MKTIAIGSVLLALAATSALAKPSPVKVKLADKTGKDIGTATLTADKAGVAIQLDVHDLTPGDHAIHVHETAKCDGAGEKPFASAGGHFNPDKKMHGMDNPQGPHAGDMKNFTVDAKGKSKAKVIAPNVTLDSGAHGVFANGGTALVIHDKADDMKTDPAGNAGDRIACGVIMEPVSTKAPAKPDAPAKPATK